MLSGICLKTPSSWRKRNPASVPCFSPVRRMRCALLLVVVSLLASLPLSAAPEKTPPSQTVDAGSFGVFMDGKRVATETFSIQQGSTGSSVTSTFKTDAGVTAAEQSSELQLAANGDLSNYEWKEVSPGHAQATVAPSQDFLTEHYRNSTDSKPQEQPFLLPASTSMLDDYFFVQREVLAWKYLASSCKQDKGLACPLKQAVQFGILNAHSRASALVSVQFSGREKITLHGVEKELVRLDMKTDTGDWALWLDDQDHFKMLRILNPESKTEAVRD